MSVETDEEMPLSAHVEEMVKRFLVVAVVATVGMVVTFFFSEDLILAIWYNFVDSKPHVYQPFGEILTQLKFSAMAGLALSIPVLVYETFEFMKPGLYPNERRYFIAVVPVSVFLVATGIAFSYFVALRVLFDYFIYYSNDIAVAGLGLVETFDLIISFSLGMGIVFQIPLLMFLAIKMRVASREWFESKRVLIWGASITVATVISGSFDPTGVAGFIAAATMITLFELTLLLLRFTGTESSGEPDVGARETDRVSPNAEVERTEPETGEVEAVGVEGEVEEVGGEYVDEEATEVGTGVETKADEGKEEKEVEVDETGTGEEEEDGEADTEVEGEDTTREAFYRGAVEVASSARKEGIKILVAFLLGLLSAILVLRMYAFEAITRQTLRLARGAGYAVETSYINPFEVVLLQAKIGIFVGVLFAVPAVIYSARDSLRKRGYWVDAEWTSRGRVTGFVVGAVALFFGGIAYAYFVMIPYILQFVSAIAVTADIKPFFRISSFVNFVLVYSLLFGLIAQLPFVMVFTVKSGMVSYRFYRYKWRYFVVVASVVAAIVTSPDPMTQLVVLGPMVVVYFVGLGVVRVAAREEIRMQERLEKEQDETGSAGAEGSTVEALRSVMSSGSEKEPVDKSEVSDPEAGEVKTENTQTGDEMVERGLIEVVSSVANSLKSHGVKIGVVFLGVTSLAFYWLVYYGVEAIRDRTVSYMPPELARQVSTVQLEIFEVVFLVVKYSLIAGVVAVVPMIIYYSWDALVKESVIEGDGSVFFYVSRVGVVVGLFVGGVLYAYFGMIPVLISLLSNSIVESGMVASFTIADFINFVFLVTVITGVLAEMPAAMYVLVSSKITRYETLKSKWRHFTVGVFALGALVTSPDPFTMVVVALPMSGFYLVSLGITRVLCHRTIKEVREERRKLGLMSGGQ